jgi:protein-disulfide isomerase
MKKSAPKTLSKQTATIIIVISAVILIGVVKVIKLSQGHGGQAALARVQGNPNAPLRITEWVDFQCPACASGAVDLKKYLSTFPDKVYLEVKYFPLGGHMHSLEAAKFGECAARQGKFWPYYETVFERQPQWRDLFDAHPVFEEIAKQIGLNDGKLQACLAEDDVREKILKEKDQGQSLGVQSTPTYFINGKMTVGPKLMREEAEKVLGIAPATAEPQPAAGG